MKSKKTVLLSLFLIITIYNVLMFFSITEKTYNFWISYIFTTISIVCLGGVFFAQITRKSVKQNVKNSPLAWVAWEYFFLQLIIGLFEVYYPTNYRMSLILNVFIFGINIISLSIVSTEKKEIERVEQKVTEKVFFVKSIQEELESIKDDIKSENILNELQNLLDVVKYSDPMSHSKLSDIESQIEVKIANLKECIQKGNTNETLILINQIEKLFTERNRKIKLYKGISEPNEYEKPANNRLVVLSCVLIIVLLISGIAIYYSIILPNSKYRDAEKLLSNKNYIEAKKAFEKLDGYKDSDEKAKESMYKYANSLVEEENYEKAISIFDDLKDYNDSQTQKTEVTYKYASILLEKQKYEEAEKQYNLIPNYKDSQEKSKECIYLFATNLLENKSYTKAAEQFMKLDNYKDSRTKLLEIYNLFGDKDVIYFGKYKGKPIEWQILDTKDNKVLLITANPIDEMSYNSEYKAIDWENCTLRKWLNEDFYDTFESEEKAKLLKNSSELDTIFLLSNENVKSYPKLKNCNSSWWVDTRGSQKTTAMYVEQDGRINQEGDIVTKLHGIRPSIWLNLE